LLTKRAATGFAAAFSELAIKVKYKKELDILEEADENAER
jgi:hypothetical protein